MILQSEFLIPLDCAPNPQSAIDKPAELRTPTSKFRIQQTEVKWIDVTAH